MSYNAPTQSVTKVGVVAQVCLGITAVLTALVILGYFVPNLLSGIAYAGRFVAIIAAAVAVIVWMYRMADNFRRAHRSLTFQSVWAIVGWLLIPLVWIVPTLQLNEIWKKSVPDGQPNHTSNNPMVWIWFATGPITIFFLSRGFFSLVSEVYELDSTTPGGLSEFQRRVVMSNGLEDRLGWFVATDLAMIVAAVLFVLIIREISRRHDAAFAPTMHQQPSMGFPQG